MHILCPKVLERCSYLSLYHFVGCFFPLFKKRNTGADFQNFFTTRNVTDPQKTAIPDYMNPFTHTKKYFYLLDPLTNTDKLQWKTSISLQWFPSPIPTRCIVKQIFLSYGSYKLCLKTNSIEH